MKVRLLFAFALLLFTLAQAGCDSNAVDSPLLTLTVSFDANASARFPNEPQKMENELPLPDGKTLRSSGLYLRDEDYTFEAMAMDGHPGVKPDIERLCRSMFNRDTPIVSIMRQETLPDGKEISYVLGSGTRLAKSVRFVVIPDEKIYMTVFTVNAEGVPDQDVLHLEKAFHQSLRIGGKRIADSLDMTDLIADRETSINASIAARDEVIRKNEERMAQAEAKREEQAQRAAENNRESMGRMQDRMASDLGRGRGPRRPQAGTRSENRAPVEFSVVPDDNGWRPDPPSDTPPEPEARQNTAHSSPETSDTMPGGQRLGHSLKGTSFLEEVPTRSILVGFQVTLKKGWGSDLIESIQPLYRSLDGSEASKGGVMGKTTGESVRLFAPKGYAIGGLEGRAVAVVDGFSLVYMKIKPDGTLDPNDTKKSDWVGNEKTGARSSIDGKGKPVKEIRGASDEFISSLELVF